MRWLIYLAFMWQLCFLWGFKLVRPSCVTHCETSRKQLQATMFSSCYAQRTKRKRQYSWSNRDSVPWKAKAICGTTSLRVTVPALFYESVKRGTKAIRKSKTTTTTTTTNWTNEVKPQTRRKLKQFAPRMVGTLFLCLSLYIYWGAVKGIFHTKPIKHVSLIESTVGCWVCTVRHGDK